MVMTDMQYVKRACEMLKIDLLPPTKAVPKCIIGTFWDAKGYGHSVIDATNWAEAKQQLESWRINRLEGQK